ncbi:hypothetical protein [Luteimonas changyuni]|uniref:hypothetical protein n=1 Tax=Luteimonas sp. MJ145 TaxID=3129234 RepID=UPI0031BA9909
MTRPSRRDPLQPTERELADALAQTAPTRGPAPDLDATILAAAREAAGERPAAQAAGAAAETGRSETTVAAAPATATASTSGAGHHRRRRSPAWLRGGALAATLVIAVGVAWQMRSSLEPPVMTIETEAPAASVRSLPEAAPPPAEAARARTAAQDAASQAQPAPEPAAPPLEPAAAPRPAVPPGIETTSAAVGARDAAAAGQARRAAASSRAEAASSEARKARPERREAAPVVFDAPSPMDAPAAAPQPAPPPPAPAPQRPASVLALPPPAGSAARPEAAATQSADAAGHHDHAEDWFDQPLDDTPPASVDSPAVREAWLARIRELVAAERYDEARESFAEFRRRHPDAPLPDGLRTLLEE